MNAEHEPAAECEPAPRLVPLLGATSLLGFHLACGFPQFVQPFKSPGNRARAARRWPSLQPDDSVWLRRLVHPTPPPLVLYCHAVCDVSKCEADPAWAYDVNVRQLERVLEALPASTRVVYVSSDHVFGGDGVYDEQSPVCPISVYGRTRAAAEDAVLQRANALVIRVGLGVGASVDGRSGYRDWLRYRTEQRLPMTIIKDEGRSAVWGDDLAVRVMQFAWSGARGVRHVAATQAVSREVLARYLLRELGLPETYHLQSRHEQAVPHLGWVELATSHSDVLAEPLPSIVETVRTWRTLDAAHRDGRW